MAGPPSSVFAGCAFGDHVVETTPFGPSLVVSEAAQPLSSLTPDQRLGWPLLPLRHR
jgi:hypothetical protein